MNELGPQELEELVQELGGESDAEEALSPEVAQLLRDLDPERPMEPKVEAVRQLGGLSTSNPQIVKALADASMWDANAQFRRLAAAALLAPAHQAVIEQHPELLPRYVTNLLREIKEAGVDVAEPDLQEVADSRQEASTSPVEDIVHTLEHGSTVRARARAAERLGQVEESSLEIVEALIAAREDDPFHTVRKAAEEALRAPVHEALLQQDAGLMERARQEAAPRDWGAELLAAPVKPERLQIEAQGSTLSLSWKDGVLHKVLSAGLTVLLVLLLAYALFAGTYSGEGVGIVVVALLLPGYWALVAFVNSTQIKLGPGEWTFQRGPFPFPNRRFYSGRARIDPAAYIEIRTVQVEEKRRGGYGGGSSSDIGGAIGEVVVGALVEQFMEPDITYSLHARAKDGSDKLLLDRLEGHEADYLKHTLQDMLDAEYQGGIDDEPGERVDIEASPAP